MYERLKNTFCDKNAEKLLLNIVLNTNIRNKKSFVKVPIEDFFKIAQNIGANRQIFFLENHKYLYFQKILVQDNLN
jgi:hypothetical protein